jgi:Flp pilus assembly protein TadD
MSSSIRIGTAVVALCALALGAGLSGCAPRESERGVPEEVLRHNVLGTAYLGQQKWAEAEGAFAKALGLRPTDPLLLNNQAVALAQQGRIEEAEALLEQAIAADAENPYAHYNLGLILKNRGEFESATAHFEAVARHDPNDLLTHYNLGIVYSRIGRENEAETEYRKALSQDPTHVSTLYALGRFLLQKGEQEEGVTLISRSQEIRARSGLDEAVGSQYGEQGPYAMGVDYPGDALAAPEPVEVRFDKLAEGEIVAGASGGSPLHWTAGPRSGDGRPAVFVVDGTGGARAFDLDGVGDPVVPSGDERVVAVAAGDIDNDETVELVALLLDQERVRAATLPADGEGDPIPVSEGTLGIDAVPTGVDLTLVDWDHDGDLDLFWCWVAVAGGCALGTNDGSGSFDLRVSDEHGFEPDLSESSSVRVAFSDIDNDRDVDLLVARTGRVDLFKNQRDGSFDERSDEAGLGAALGDATGSMVVADINKDGWMDLVLGVGGGTRLYLNRLGRFASSMTFEGSADLPERIVVLDYDNDGFLDLARSGAGGPSIHRNLGAGEWSDRGIVPKVSDRRDAIVSPLAALDADGDGDLDLVTHEKAVPPRLALMINEGGNANRWIRIESRGIADNKFGVGSKVEVLAGALRQKFEITGALPLHAGLGSRETVESVRYLWPSGILQDEIELRAGETREVAELDRKGTSCPLLYARASGGWRFVTDFLGGCAIGYQHSPGVFSVPDTDEYVKIVGGITPDADGTLRLRVNNQLQEVIWLDQIELIAVDHPEGTEIFPNERLMPGPPWPEFELFASSDIRPVAAARSVDDGADLADLLVRLDRKYVRNFALLPFKGYAEPHSIELDLGAFPNRERVVLLLDGWIDYADSTANLAAHQAGRRLDPPRLTVADGRGGWLETGHLMGFPAGLPKTVTIDLTGLLPTDDHRVRIATNMRIYWDRARLLVGGSDLLMRVRRLRPLSAELRFGGFPREASPDGLAPFGYDPEGVSRRSPWTVHVGRYTAFGDVRGHLHEVDDRFVTTRSGDEIELGFASAGPLKKGWSRTYLFYADGFGKDMDANSAANDTVGPIPFHGMPVYPYADDVTPPSALRGEGRRARVVLASPRGWHGAVPQPLVAEPVADAR